MKELITAMNISEARKAGERSISVPPGALITPQARDDAKSYGIALVTQEEPVSVSVSSGANAPGVAPRRQNLNSATAVMAGFERLAGQTSGTLAVGEAQRLPKPEPAPQTFVQPAGAGLTAGLADTLAAAVLGRLNALLAPRGGIAAFPGLEATIAAITAEYSGSASPSSALGLAGVPGVDVVHMPEQVSGRRVQGEVEVEEALSPGQDGPGVTRLSWSGSSFAWTFEFDEVLAVTKGEIEVKSASSPMAGLVLASGEALRVRAGTSLTLTARGDASCLCSSWPAKN